MAYERLLHDSGNRFQNKPDSVPFAGLAVAHTRRPHHCPGRFWQQEFKVNGTRRPATVACAAARVAARGTALAGAAKG